MSQQIFEDQTRGMPTNAAALRKAGTRRHQQQPPPAQRVTPRTRPRPFTRAPSLAHFPGAKRRQSPSTLEESGSATAREPCGPDGSRRRGRRWPQKRSNVIGARAQMTGVPPRGTARRNAGCPRTGKAARGGGPSGRGRCLCGEQERGVASQGAGGQGFISRLALCASGGASERAEDGRARVIPRSVQLRIYTSAQSGVVARISRA